MTCIHITPQQKTLLLDILQGDFDVLVFGSRLIGKWTPCSDLDVCLKSKAALPILTLAQLKDSLTQSNIPFHIDLMDYHRISTSFRQIIDQQAKLLSQCQAVLE